ncbi:MAG: hypothetical protein H7145_08130, partial [Akkermansiaceae bacterium]|nr:hypothetical protein [Armatimonadota bacterium]
MLTMKQKRNLFALVAAALMVAPVATAAAFAQDAMPGMKMGAKSNVATAPNTLAAPKRLGERIDPADLPKLPANLPGWMSGRGNYEIFYKRGTYNFDVYKIPALAFDFNATGVGHSMAYEEMVRGNAAKLEKETFDKIVYVLNHPPKLSPTERSIAPTFARR